MGKTDQDRLYRVWSNMKQRCLNKKCPRYFRYGGRGISICEDWENRFTSFYAWAIVNGYANGLQLDRINNDGNYEPSNCRFVTPLVNINNRGYIDHSKRKPRVFREDLYMIFNGENMKVKDVAKMTGKSISKVVSVRANVFKLCNTKCKPI